MPPHNNRMLSHLPEPRRSEISPIALKKGGRQNHLVENMVQPQRTASARHPQQVERKTLFPSAALRSVSCFSSPLHSTPLTLQLSIVRPGLFFSNGAQTESRSLGLLCFRRHCTWFTEEEEDYGAHSLKTVESTRRYQPRNPVHCSVVLNNGTLMNELAG